MTPEERLDHFMGLVEDVLPWTPDADGVERPPSMALLADIRERLSQGVQAWALEADAEVADMRAAVIAAAANLVEREAAGRWRGNQEALLAVAEDIRGLR